MVPAPGQPDQVQGRLGRQRVGRDLGVEGDVLGRGKAWNQVIELKDEADMVAAKTGQLRIVQAGQIGVVEIRLAATGPVEAAQNVQKRLRVLKKSRGPEFLKQ